MKPAREWFPHLTDIRPGAGLVEETGRDGFPTLKAGSIYLHSRYCPHEEAKRLVESAGLALDRPVLVVGLGLGYHVLELLERGAQVAVMEPDPAVAKLALAGPMQGSQVLLGIGAPEEIGATPAFQAFAKKNPQVFVHPPSDHIHPGYSEACEALAARAGLAAERLNIAVVGPMFGGSLPIAGYLERAFQSLGHRTLLVDNACAWDLYDSMSHSVSLKRVERQLGSLFSNFLGEWSYARVAEFSPEICIALAQAPVPSNFASRLRKDGTVCAFWFVENWRHLDYWQAIAHDYDYFFHIQPGEFERRLAEAGCRHHAFVQTGCDPAIHRPMDLTEAEREEMECEISFAGAGYPNRNQVFTGLTDHDFKIWGVNWTARELAGCIQRPDERFTPELFAKIVAASRININLHSSTTHPGVDPQCDAINPRVFEIAACGGFQLCDPCKGLDGFFDPASELPTYHNLAELRDRIDYYLAHPEEREAIARNARDRALRDHTYERRAQQMLDLILERHGGRILKRGVRVQRTCAEMAERVGRDSELGRYLASLPPDLLFTQENLNKQLTSSRSELSYPEAIFMYLRDMRNTAEALLEGRDLGPAS